ncbi:hypothetical protein FBU30_005600 [Linnemannia zychae]|nr:hypothetical protein FBU30_005600 [Linnemannia zychae]
MTPATASDDSHTKLKASDRNASSSESTYDESNLETDNVVLSSIINTIDGDNTTFYTQFDNFKKSCIVEDFMTPTKRQLDFVNLMLNESKFLRTMNIDSLDIWSLRRACDLRTTLKQNSPFYEVPNVDAVEEELTICLLVHILVLYHGDIIPRIGEISTVAVRSDRRRVEGVVSRDRASTQARGRKIDLFFQLLGEKNPVELFCWEAKTSDAGSMQLQIQRCKNIRPNARLIGTTYSMAGLDRKMIPTSLPSPILLDIAGRMALPYKIQKIDSDVFVAGAVLKNQDLIYLPCNKDDMINFLKEGGLTGLLNIKVINAEYTGIIKDGIRRMKREEAKNRMLGCESSHETRNLVINTPIKKQRAATSYPSLKKARSNY